MCLMCFFCAIRTIFCRLVCQKVHEFSANWTPWSLPYFYFYRLLDQQQQQHSSLFLQWS